MERFRQGLGFRFAISVKSAKKNAVVGLLGPARSNLLGQTLHHLIDKAGESWDKGTMSYDPEDAAREAYETEMAEYFDHETYEEHYEEAIKEFTAERLVSYYKANPDLAKPAHYSLVYAQSLMPEHPKAALVFAFTAAELGIKVVLLKPIVIGLVHNEALASLITDLTIGYKRVGNLKGLLTEILKRFGGVDLKTFERTGSTRTLWEEIDEVREARNRVIHGGENAENSTAELAIAVAHTLLHDIFPQVIAKLVQLQKETAG